MMGVKETIEQSSEILCSLLVKQREYVQYFFDEVDQQEVREALSLCLECKGLLIFCGVGKSGIIAQKIANTFVSIGRKALFLPVSDVLHGDIGIISSEDLVFMFSKSGQSEELLRLIPYIQSRGSLLIAVVSDQNSHLAQKADHVVYLPVKKELCPFNLIPTTSTVAQLLFGDLLAIAFMEERSVGIDLYATNHPLGMIGRKVTCKVKDLMKKEEELPFCSPDQKLIEVLVDLSNKKCGCLLIISPHQELLGIFTDGDLRRALQAEGGAILEKSMKELMCISPICVDPEDLILEAIGKMQSIREVMMAPVTQAGKVVGLIHMHAIVRGIDG